MSDEIIKQMARDTDGYMEDFAKNETDPSSLVCKVAYIYNYYKRCEQFLDYSYETHFRFWKFIENPQTTKTVVDWFATNVTTWSSFKYEWTNGKMDWYSGGCFGEDTLITMYNGELKAIKHIKKGDQVYIPITNSTAKVECVVKWLQPVPCVKYQDLFITPYHPIMPEQEWVFPISLLSDPIPYQQNIYNLILDTGHVILANNIKACTLGHGITTNDVISHPFFGTEAVIQSFQTKEGWNEGLVTVAQAVRDPTTNLVMNFI